MLPLNGLFFLAYSYYFKYSATLLFLLGLLSCYFLLKRILVVYFPLDEASKESERKVLPVIMG